MTRRALLLSGSIGSGHDVMAEALADELGARGWESRTLDCLPLMGERAGRLGAAVFKGLLAVPGVYDAFHFASLRPGNGLALRMDAAAQRRLLPRLVALIGEDPPDLVVGVFPTGASAAATLAREGRLPAVAVFCTDVTPHRLWVHDGVDVYLVTSPAAAAGVRRYQPNAQVLVTPAPVRAGFRSPPSRTAARAQLGVPISASCVLLMGGAWGMGPLLEIAVALAEQGVHVCAVAGHNNRLEKQLTAAAAGLSTLHPFGYTDLIPTLMSASDLVLTTSGDTCSEARAIGRDLLLFDVVPGHGRDNLQHELELGNAAVTATDPPIAVAAVRALLSTAAPRPAVDPTPGFGLIVDEMLAAIGLGQSDLPEVAGRPGGPASISPARRGRNDRWPGTRSGRRARGA